MFVWIILRVRHSPPGPLLLLCTLARSIAKMNNRRAQAKIYKIDQKYTVEPVYNGYLGTRYIWPLYKGGCYRENLHNVVSSISVAMTIINE